MRERPSPLAGLLAVAAGACWGLGLARFLALQAHWSFFLSPLGTGLVLVPALAASLLWWWFQAGKTERPLAAALRLTPLLLPLVDLALGPPQPWRAQVLLLGSLLAVALTHLRLQLTRWAWFLLIVALSLTLYLPDVARWVGRADTFEFQVVAPRLGIAHPSGYPLYILVGKLFSLLPFSTVAWRVNLSSAVCSALAAGFLYLALEDWRVEESSQAERALWSLIPPLTLAFSPTLWSRAVEAEVYGLNALLVALCVWVAVRWVRGAMQAERALPLLGLLVGVGMASHLTLGALLLLAIPLALAARARPSMRSVLVAAALLAGGLALYLYIPLRWPAVNDGETMSGARFLAFVTNAESGGALHPWAFFRDLSRWGLVLRLLRKQVGWIGLVGALFGLITLTRRRWSLALGTALAFGAWVWFNLSFYVADPDYSAFLIPAHVIVIFWLGVGLDRIVDFLRSRATHFLPAMLALALLLPLNRLWMTGPGLDTAQERADDAWGRYVLSLPLARDAAVLADSEKFPPLYYLQQVEGMRPDLDLVTRFDEAGYREELLTRLEAGQTVYLARYLPHLEGYFLRSLSPLVEVGTAPLENAPVDAELADEAYEGGPKLIAFDLETDPRQPRVHHLTLYWRADTAVEDDLEVRLRLVDQAEQVVWSSEGARPVGGNYPTNAWSVGAVVPDYHRLSPSACLAVGEYQLQVGLFPRFSNRGLPISGEEDTWYGLAPLTMEPAPADVSLAHRASLAFGAMWLTSYDLPREANAGCPLRLELAWEGVDEGASGWVDWIVAGDEMTGVEFELAPGVVCSRHVLTAPVAAERVYRLQVGVEGHRARCGWLAPPTPACALGEVTVRSAPEGVTNFDDRIILTEAEVEREQLRPGEELPVTIHWRALRQLAEDYTVTVQLLGPDGRLRGQVDSWPVQGALPTSQWQPGQAVTDPYRVPLEPDSPPGRYQVVVGWYLLGTMERLPVVDADGAPIADHAVVGEVEVSGQ